MDRTWSPLITEDPEYAESVRQRILHRTVVSPSGCWVWDGPPNNSGYGVITLRLKRKATAHNVSYVAFIGPIPEGLDLDHEMADSNSEFVEHVRG